jgi:hypothetical protein
MLHPADTALIRAPGGRLVRTGTRAGLPGSLTVPLPSSPMSFSPQASTERAAAAGPAAAPAGDAATAVRERAARAPAAMVRIIRCS